MSGIIKLTVFGVAYQHAIIKDYQNVSELSHSVSTNAPKEKSALLQNFQNRQAWQSITDTAGEKAFFIFFQPIMRTFMKCALTVMTV